MGLYKEEKPKNTKVNKILIASIIVTIIIIILLIAAIIYVSLNSSKEVALIDGKYKNEIFKYMKIENDNTGKEQVLFSIKGIAQYLGYKAYNGEYKSATEDKNKCYVISESKKNGTSSETEGKEVANFELNSNVISKLDITNQNSEYEYFEIDKKVIQIDGELYTTINGLEIAFNTYFKYDSSKKSITAFTLEYLNEKYAQKIKDGEYKGYQKLATESLKNEKALLDEMLIVQADNKKYGVIDFGNAKTILEAKYDSIEYMQTNKSFIVSSKEKKGIITSKGTTKVDPIYDDLILVDSKRDYFLVKKNDLYGMIDGEGNQVIYIENEKIGIDISQYEVNEIKSGYILLDRFVPIMQNGKWGFFDLKMKRASRCKYDTIGSLSTNGSNTYGLLILPEYDFIVVQKDRKYAFFDEEKNEDIVPFVFEKMYIRISSGEKRYYMATKEDSYNIFKSLEKMGIKKKSDTALFNEPNNSIDNNE